MPSFDLENYCSVCQPGYLRCILCESCSNVVKLMQYKRATLARLVPTVALAFAESKVVQKYTYPDLEYFSCSAAPLKVGIKILI